MQILVKAAFPALLVLVSAAFVVWHMREYRAALAGSQRATDRQYFRRRFRRRMRVAGLLCLLAVAVFLGQFISQEEQPSVFVWYWSGVMLAVLSLLVFALYDYVDAQRKLLDEQKRSLVETARQVKAARREFQRLQAAHRENPPDEGSAEYAQPHTNGHAPPADDPSRGETKP